MSDEKENYDSTKFYLEKIITFDSDECNGNYDISKIEISYDGFDMAKCYFPGEGEGKDEWTDGIYKRGHEFFVVCNFIYGTNGTEIESYQNFCFSFKNGIPSKGNFSIQGMKIDFKKLRLIVGNFSGYKRNDSVLDGGRYLTGINSVEEIVKHLDFEVTIRKHKK
jgi:hypothetical protein